MLGLLVLLKALHFLPVHDGCESLYHQVEHLYRLVLLQVVVCRRLVVVQVVQPVVQGLDILSGLLLGFGVHLGLDLGGVKLLDLEVEVGDALNLLLHGLHEKVDPRGVIAHLLLSLQDLLLYL